MLKFCTWNTVNGAACAGKLEIRANLREIQRVLLLGAAVPSKGRIEDVQLDDAHLRLTLPPELDECIP